MENFNSFTQNVDYIPLSNSSSVQTFCSNKSNNNFVNSNNHHHNTERQTKEARKLYQRLKTV